MTEEQIKQMVDRFLGWKLPDDFRPDGGISFEPHYNNGTATGGKRQPVGTNLLTATQAEAMVRHMLNQTADEHLTDVQRSIREGTFGVKSAN